MDCRTVNVRPAAEADTEAWDAFIQARPDATVFHRRAWSDAVADAYGHRPRHLAAWSEQRLVGLLPLMEVRSLLVGRVLVSVPYATYGGIVAEDDNVTAALAEGACALARDRGTRYLELRHREARPLDLPTIDRYDTFRKALPERAEDVLPGLPRKTRTAVRRSLKALGEKAVETGPHLLDVVYDLYAFTMRRLGSPNYRRRFFHALADRYGDDCVALVVWDGATPVAGVISFIFRDEIVPYFSGSLPEGQATRANNLMYSRLMEIAVERGLRAFDFNRTRRDNRGPYDFKRHHGFEPSPLAYHVYRTDGGPLPNLSPSNRKFALAARLWQRLPLCVTRPAGACVTKWIP